MHKRWTHANPGRGGCDAALEVIVIVAILINTITLAVQVRVILFPEWRVCLG